MNRVAIKLTLLTMLNGVKTDCTDTQSKTTVYSCICGNNINNAFAKYKDFLYILEYFRKIINRGLCKNPPDES